MQAGRLRNRIRIERRAGSKDGWTKTPPPGWEPVVDKLPADIRHLSGTQTIKADAVTPVVRASIRIRFRRGIDAGMRVVHGDAVYQIQSVLMDELARKFTDLVCEVVT